MNGPSSMRDRAYLAWGLMTAVSVALFTLVALWTDPLDGLAVAVAWVLCGAWVLSALVRARSRNTDQEQRDR